ncbi:MAG: hypothetical protein ABIP63_06280, partial [Thermoanaerobaculia bacterium]
MHDASKNALRDLESRSLRGRTSWSVILAEPWATSAAGRAGRRVRRSLAMPPAMRFGPFQLDREERLLFRDG